MRSECEERVGKSPKELMTGESHPHWLEMLGFNPHSADSRGKKIIKMKP
jgi:hypothetical protein